MFSLCADDFSSWRQHARELLAGQVAPSDVHWTTGPEASLFTGCDPLGQKDRNTAVSVPKRFLSLAKQVACFIDHQQPARKWSLLYSLLWRTLYEHRDTMMLQSDPEVQQVKLMSRAVSRDIHKMHAFVRFQRCQQNSESQDSEYFTAWFEPDHAIVEATAPFFAKRFAGMTWSILTPYGCAHWDRQRLRLSPGVSRPELVGDDFELFWKTYYCHIFNPARLKEKAMMAEMPKKYWRYLPEAQCIKALTINASSEMVSMIERAPGDPDRLRAKSTKLRKAQNRLRADNRR